MFVCSLCSIRAADPPRGSSHLITARKSASAIGAAASASVCKFWTLTVEVRRRASLRERVANPGVVECGAMTRHAMLLTLSAVLFQAPADFEVVDQAAFQKLFPKGAAVRKLAGDMKFIEGP